MILIRVNFRLVYYISPVGSIQYLAWTGPPCDHDVVPAYMEQDMLKCHKQLLGCRAFSYMYMQIKKEVMYLI